MGFPVQDSSPAAALTWLGGNTLVLATTDRNLFALTTGGNLTRLGSLDHRSKGLAVVDLPPAAVAASTAESPSSEQTAVKP